MPFSGKTTIGKCISETEGIKFFDIDLEIERREKIPISNIFKIKGEDYFRKIESKVVDELRLVSKSIIATGGGTPIFNGNMNKLKEIGYTVFLDVPINELKRRAENNKNRPLLQGNFDETLVNMYSNRILIYRQSHFTMICCNRTPIEICELILKQYKRNNNNICK